MNGRDGLVAELWHNLVQGWRSLCWTLINSTDRFLMPAWVERRLVFRERRRRISLPVECLDTLYIDVSVIYQNDAGTGIQRVVREIFHNLPRVGLANLNMVPVIVRRRRNGYETIDGQPIVGGPQAVFLGLDFATDSVFRNRRELANFSRNGGRIWFLVHDTLPMSHPFWFTAASRVRYRRWMRVCAMLADGFFCVSSNVAGELTDLLRQRYGLADEFKVATVCPGSNIRQLELPNISKDLPLVSGLTPGLFAKAVLVVGTLEPRKGHAGLLEAFDRIWEEQRGIPLILIGRPGWNTDDLQRSIRNHHQYGQQLFWLEDVNDRALHAAYVTCKMVAVPSLAEGYGLPLDEALALGAPVFARDIPVFRRHGAMNLGHFPVEVDAGLLASMLVEFYSNATRSKDQMPLRQWSETAVEVLETICREHCAGVRPH